VLIAIFVMGIGMLAILVLFPLAALNMARALKDDRIGTLAANAEAMANARGVKTDTNIVSAMTTAPAGFQAPDPNGPSYPVIVDPYFVNNGGFNTVGNVPTMQRVIPATTQNELKVSPPGSTLPIDRWFSLVDDLYFDSNGVPTVTSANPNTAPQQITGLSIGPLRRQGYYTFSYLMRRLVTQQPTSTQLSVIVYQNRAIQVPVMENVFTMVSTTNPLSPPAKGDTSIVLTGGTPDLRRGSWIMDVTYEQKTSPVTGNAVGYAHAQCYKVMDAMNTANGFQVEIYPPLKDSFNPLYITGSAQVVVLDSATEVFERGSGR
jgi:hypothetical protein